MRVSRHRHVVLRVTAVLVAVWLLGLAHGQEVSKHPGVKKFLYSEDGLVVYENLSFEMRHKVKPTLHLYAQGATDSFHQQSLENFTFQELHKLMHLIGLKRKPDEVLAQENAMKLEEIQAAHAEWKKMISKPGSSDGAQVVQ
ncbi:hypothetical protein A3770_05p36960 [Chloropicon primus]|uniref:Selenoprotein F/M domain-containing protein n=1 Tax=Chloropicon primus TaxID=1764295 RepID=A0A5B8MKM1_9CHLO|nr:hypothetical protein A3770_05p36960 [Chloropicon primus]|eukprot:QDZ21178.1 hypothetical protein A3770_05p36960 [Chloropicon primus]